MKKILVVYYSQTGQLESVIHSITKDVLQSPNIEIDYHKIVPLIPYPFPWGDRFFDVFPDSVEEKGCDLEPLKIDFNSNYDLVIIGCQSWFLSPSIPLTAFLKHPNTRSFLKDKNILTIHGVRNMCFSAQESIKKMLSDSNAKLVGNIILGDTSPNYVSAIAVNKWLVYGNKGPYRFLPDAGISSTSIKQAQRFGKHIIAFVESSGHYPFQQELVKDEAVRVKFSVLTTDLNAKKMFRKFSQYTSKADYNSDQWKKRVNFFKMYLQFTLFVLSPVFMLIFSIVNILLRFKTKKIVKYYQSVRLE